MTRSLSLLFLLCLACAGAASADAGLLPDGHLDTTAVRDSYLRSDIAAVRSLLEGFIRNHPKDVPAAEKVFTHLYLAAAYAGDADGRAKAEAHFRAALKIDPNCDPAGLYLPPAGLARFEVLRAEALRARAEADPASAPAPSASAPMAGAGPSASDPSAGPVPAASDSAAASGVSAGGRAPASVAVAPEPAGPEAFPEEGSLPRPSHLFAQSDGFIPASEFVPAPASPEARVPDAKAEGKAGKEEHGGWLWWTVGGSAAVAAGAGVLAWVQSHADPEPRRVEIDATLK